VFPAATVSSRNSIIAQNLRGTPLTEQQLRRSVSISLGNMRAFVLACPLQYTRRGIGVPRFDETND
jgi:hypothetical protein